ncbi:MAG: TIGR04283 family arsenosugar biosynthesis glycosyltransferase [Planctomycetaceae bacterium]
MTAPVENSSASLSISVIIPTLNEAEHIQALIQETRSLGTCEIIVVDGGSTDRTSELAVTADKCLSVSPGRAIQQNAGAEIACGDVLLFLHADCRLEPGTLEAIREVMSDQQTIAGCFRQRIEAKGLRYRLLEWGNALRVRCLKWMYGDQAIFVRREVFNQIGGFPDVKLMEDLLLAKRLKKRGRLALLPSRVRVSARRWQTKGVIRQTLRNWSFVLLSQCGVSPNWLAKFYPHVR